ncbi:hypothetical protein EBU99_10440 [bacterium]|nr:hypothetical protein [bacterium]
MARKDEQTSAQFDTGFGSAGGTFGGSAGGAKPQGAPSGGAPGGEFSTGFGGGTNAVSQIFRDGGSGGGDDKRRKMMMMVMLGAAVALLGGGIYYFIFEESASTTEAPTVAKTPPPKAVSGDKAKGVAANPAEKSKDDASIAEEDGEEDEDGLADAGDEGEEDELESVMAPSASGSYTYNEIGGGPMVSAPEGTAIEVSRNQDFSVMYIAGTTNKAGQLRIPNPPPGKVFWRVAGKSEVNEISIAPAPKLNLGLKLGASVGASETLQWSSSGSAGHYRLEFSSEPNFAAVSHSFSTNKKQVTLSGVSPGNYFVRLGGLNVASGRWEFTRGSSVEVK